MDAIIVNKIPLRELGHELACSRNFSSYKDSQSVGNTDLQVYIAVILDGWLSRNGKYCQCKGFQKAVNRNILQGYI
jgi:hypothetical protein